MHLRNVSALYLGIQITEIVRTKRDEAKLKSKRHPTEQNICDWRIRQNHFIRIRYTTTSSYALKLQLHPDVTTYEKFTRWYGFYLVR